MPRITLPLLAFALCLCSCGTYPVSTPSGRPEVTVRPPLARAKNVAIETMMANGYSLTSQSANMLTFECQLPPAQSALYLMAVGNSYYSQPKATIRLTFLQNSGAIKIFGNVEASTQGPFGQMQNTDLTNGKAGQQVQGMLVTVQRRIGQG